MSAPAKKSSADDKDMENDTWNFKSMTEDDPMDFGFGSPAKNSFKLDMGFDLDGDFGNMSSFKMDMPGFDFSSPAKKTTKTKESSEVSDDKSSGKVKQKKDLFSSFYDFDAYVISGRKVTHLFLANIRGSPKLPREMGLELRGKGSRMIVQLD